ncbi:MAG: hypothetical protein Q9179_002167 [Wetmoreana sp. 5 TL-2023]
MALTDDTRYIEGGYKAVVVAAVLILMLFLMVSGRCYSRRLQKVMLEADDYVLVLATLFTIARAGTRSSPTANDSHGENKLMQASFISWMALYGASVALSKCAILLLYIRVFTTNNRAFTVAACVIGFLVGATGVATTVGSIFQCTPMARNWNGAVQGHCINKLDFARYTAIPNVVTGFVMLLLPMPMVWRLSVTIQQKIALTATFLHGTMSVILGDIDVQ